MTIDPICRRRLPREPRWILTLSRRSFGFCSEACRQSFLEALERRRTHLAARTGELLRGQRAPKAEA
jgi:YHS domain-containing protein